MKYFLIIVGIFCVVFFFGTRLLPRLRPANIRLPQLPELPSGKVLHWTAMTVMLVIIGLLAIPVTFWGIVGGSLQAIRLTAVIILAIVAFNLASQWNADSGRRWIRRLATLFAFVAIGSTVVNNWDSLEKQGSLKSLDQLTVKASEKIEHLLTPSPPPKEHWAGVKVITAPVSPDWSQALEVEIPYCSHVEIETMYPDVNGSYEVMAKGWPRAFAGSEPKGPTIPSDSKIKVRSTTRVKNNKGELVPKPIKLELRWR